MMILTEKHLIELELGRVYTEEEIKSRDDIPTAEVKADLQECEEVALSLKAALEPVIRKHGEQHEAVQSAHRALAENEEVLSFLKQVLYYREIHNY